MSADLRILHPTEFAHHTTPMPSRKLHDGRQDGLTPLASLSLDSTRSFSDLLNAMARTAFSGRSLGEAADILTDMFADTDCGVVLTVSGAMTVAKQGRIICDLIDRGCVQAVVATGALIAHGLTESIGRIHYRADPNHSDEELYAKGYNRIYDTLELEASLNDLSTMVEQILSEEPCPDSGWSSAEFCRVVGRRLADAESEPGILRSAWKQNVPVYIPAFTDSELGLDVATWAICQAVRQAGRQDLSLADAFRRVPPFNPFLDLSDYAQHVSRFSRLGIFTIGGGVPRNWAQQVGPFLDVANERAGTSFDVPQFRYGVRICPEPVHWGGLSGCTYSEGVSWGKFVSPADGGRFAEVYAAATLVLPLLVKGVFERLDGAA